MVDADAVSCVVLCFLARVLPCSCVLSLSAWRSRFVPGSHLQREPCPRSERFARVDGAAAVCVCVNSCVCLGAGAILQKKLSQSSERVKCVDLHPTEPWVLSALYSGNVFIWNYETQQQVKAIEVSEQPVRTAKFVPRKQWIVAGCDEMVLRVYNYNTTDRVATLTGHTFRVLYLAMSPDGS